MQTETKSQDYTATIKAPVSISEAIRKINDVAAWWSDGFNGTASKAGDTFKMDFGPTFVDFKVVQADPTKLIWDVTDSYIHFVEDKHEWTGTRVIWELKTKDGLTEITFTHRGLKPDVECFSTCQEGWNTYMASLQSLLTTGQGNPQRNSS